MRQGALWIPDWPTTAAELAGDIPVGTPAAVVGGKGVVAANVWARAAGIQRGMKRRAAHSTCPEAILLAPDPERDAQRFEPVLRALDRHIARVTIVESGSVIFAAHGAIRGAGSPEKLAEAIVGEIADIAGCEAYVGFAEGTLATLVAARHNAVIPVGKSREYLARQRTDVLFLGVTSSSLRGEVAQCLELCERLGVRSIGNIQALGSTALSTRFGKVGTLMWKLASGEDVGLSSSSLSPGEFRCTRSFEPAIDNTEQAVFAAKDIAADVAEEMSTRGAGGGRLTIAAFLANGEQYARSWMVEGGGEKDIVDRTRWQLGAWMVSSDERAEITRLELTMTELIPAGFRPTPLWGGKNASAEQAARSALRMQSLLGEEEVRSPYRIGGRDPRERYTTRAWNEAPADRRAADLPWPGAIPEPSPVILHPQSIPCELMGSCGHPVRILGDGQMTCRDQCADVSPVLIVNALRTSALLTSFSPPPSELVPLSSLSPASVSLRAAPVHTEKRRGHLRKEYIDNFAGPWIIEQRWWDTPMRRAYLQVTAAEYAYLLYCENSTWYEEGRYD